MSARHNLVEDLAALWFNTPFVIAARMVKFSQAAMLSAGFETEATRMVVEKAAAAWESALALQFGLMAEMMRVPSPRTVRANGATAERLAAKGVRPYAKRVRGNARRLKR